MKSMSFIMTVILVFPIVCAIEVLIILLYNHLSNRFQKSLNNANNPKLIKIMQEIACDYRLRVIRSGYCILSIDGVIERGKIIDDKVKDSGDCLPFFDKIQIEYSDNGNMYCIHFKLFGKYYISYGNNEVMAWANAVQRARKENKKLFSKINL